MNAYVEFQTSGNQWIPRIHPMLHEEIRSSPDALQATLANLRSGQASTIFAQLEIQMALYVAEHERILNELRRQFVMSADSCVTGFLNEHRSIPPMLLEALPHLKSYFGTDTIFSLRAPVDEAGSCTLYAVAMWPGEVVRVRDALNRFDCDWWLRRAAAASGFLTFTYELV